MARSQQNRQRNRASALAASAAFHGLLLILAFSTLKGALITGGGAEGDDAHAITVTLAGDEGGRKAPADPQTEQLKAILRQLQASELHADPQTPSATPRASLDQLLDEVDHEAAREDAKAGSGQAKTDQGGQGASASDKAVATTEKAAAGPKSKQPGQTGSSASSGSLWGQVEPCWRRMPGASAVPVSLNVTLNSQGLIAVPPVILRPAGSALEEKRLIAEARALASISACVPYHGAVAAGGKQVFRLDFAASKENHFTN